MSHHNTSSSNTTTSRKLGANTDPFEQLVNKGVLNKPGVNIKTGNLTKLGQNALSSGDYIDVASKHHSTKSGWEGSMKNILSDYNKDVTSSIIEERDAAPHTNIGASGKGGVRDEDLESGFNPKSNTHILQLKGGATSYQGLASKNQAEYYQTKKLMDPGSTTKHGGSTFSSSTIGRTMTSGGTQNTIGGKYVMDNIGLLHGGKGSKYSPVQIDKYHSFKSDVKPNEWTGYHGTDKPYNPQSNTFREYFAAPSLKETSNVDDKYSNLERSTTTTAMPANRTLQHRDVKFKKGVQKITGVDLDMSGKVDDPTEKQAKAFAGQKHVYATRRAARTEMKVNKKIGVQGGGGGKPIKQDQSIIGNKGFIATNIGQKGKKGRQAKRLSENLLKSTTTTYKKDGGDISSAGYAKAAKKNVTNFNLNQSNYVTQRLNWGIPESGSDYSSALSKSQPNTSWGNISGQSYGKTSNLTLSNRTNYDIAKYKRLKKKTS